MVVNKFKILSIILLLGITLQSFAAENNLVQLDLKKSSTDSVDLTFITTEGYNDNIMVRKKSDNKYVILIPKVQSSGYSSANLNGVRDLVSNVDVKTVNDTNGGYTKVTLITTKPLDIKTKTQKSLPVTAEQQEYKTLIAQANSIKNNIAKPEPKPVQKTEITINKAPVPVKTEVKKTTTEKPKEIKLKEVNPEKIERAKRQESLTQLINEVQKELEIPQTEISDVKDNDTKLTDLQDIQDIIPTKNEIIQNDLTSKIKAGAKTPYGKAFGGAIILMLILKLFRKNKPQVETKMPFMEKLVQDALNEVDETYSDITDDKQLTWQEKYKLYLDKSAKPVQRTDKKGNYLFIKTPVSNEIEQKRAELEKMISETTESKIEEPEIIETITDEDNIKKTIKLKAFDNKVSSLRETKRNQVKSRFKKYEQDSPVEPQKTVNLGKSRLHTNPRTLKDANLSISAVDENRLKFKPQEYIMSSVDEFFSIVDKENAQKAAEVIKNAEASLAKMKKVHSNPISKKELKSQKLKGLIVKSEYNIDDHKSFYLVNNDGQNALVGKVNDEVFVLKKFDKNITDPIKVRRDNNNVYMVKAGDFKSLVEVNDEKMGVLIEL